MNFNDHSRLANKHAFLSPSQYHWINYDQEKLDKYYLNWKRKELGTELHALAAECIKLHVQLPKSNKALNRYVNDAIRFLMSPEQVLYYSDNCFGTVDAISFYRDFLRIHDLKSGEVKASFNQLMVYEAIFCLEYEKDPDKIGAELRIYQGEEDRILVPNSDDIFRIMDKIVEFDGRINQLKNGG